MERQKPHQVGERHDEIDSIEFVITRLAHTVDV